MSRRFPRGGSVSPARPVTRRRALKLIGGTLAACTLAPSLSLGALRGAKRPNVVFILTDDHRWDAMSNMNHPFVQTPHLDRLAREGVRFNNAFVTTSLCSPSRASFLTGQYAHTHGVKNNLTPWSDSNVTLLEHFKSAGYDTAFIGKWHMPGSLPSLRGVDRFITFTVQGGQGRYFDCPLIVNGREEPSRKSYITEELTDRALEFIDGRRGNPFCLYLSHKAVHHQFLPPQDLKDLYDGVDLRLPPEADSLISIVDGLVVSGVVGPLEYHYRNYCRTITATDREVGRLLDSLEAMGILDDTVVVYAGDNGFFWGEHRLVDKRWPYEEAIRIPLIVRYPLMTADPGIPADQMALNIDLAPTLLNLAGLHIPGNMEGSSLVPVLRDRSVKGREAFLYEYFKDFPYNVPEYLAVRTGRYKYIRYQGRRKNEIFDLANDPREMNNLLGTPEGDALLPELSALMDRLTQGRGM